MEPMPSVCQGFADATRCWAQRRPGGWRCEAELAAYKIPHYLIRRDRPFPRNMASKVLKREMRQEYAALPDATRLRPRASIDVQQPSVW